MFFIAFIILRTSMIELILIDFLQCDRINHIFDRFFVLEEIFVRISISASDFEEIQKSFDRLMLNCSSLAKDECSSLVCAKKFMNKDNIIIECVSQSLIDHLDFEIFSFADSLLDFIFDGNGF
jgi:hypothetical protein